MSSSFKTKDGTWEEVYGVAPGAISVENGIELDYNLKSDLAFSPESYGYKESDASKRKLFFKAIDDSSSFGLPGWGLAAECDYYNSSTGDKVPLPFATKKSTCSIPSMKSYSSSEDFFYVEDYCEIVSNTSDFKFWYDNSSGNISYEHSWIERKPPTYEKVYRTESGSIPGSILYFTLQGAGGRGGNAYLSDDGKEMEPESYLYKGYFGGGGGGGGAFLIAALNASIVPNATYSLVLSDTSAALKRKRAGTTSFSTLLRANSGEDGETLTDSDLTGDWRYKTAVGGRGGKVNIVGSEIDQDEITIFTTASGTSGGQGGCTTVSVEHVYDYCTAEAARSFGIASECAIPLFKTSITKTVAGEPGRYLTSGSNFDSFYHAGGGGGGSSAGGNYGRGGGGGYAASQFLDSLSDPWTDWPPSTEGSGRITIAKMIKLT